MMRLPQERIDKARRRMKRRVAASLVAAMSESDMDFAAIAFRLNSTEESVRGYVYGLIECSTNDLDILSDLLLAMGYEIDWRIVRIDPSPEATAATEQLVHPDSQES